MIRRHLKHGLVAIALAAIPTLAYAAETIDYGYDAKGRLVQIIRSGSINNGVVTTYTYDRAGNRATKTTTGSPNPPPP
jgi:hypothetical protein